MAERHRSERAIRAYVRALNIADPIRLHFWDSRDLTMPQLRVMFLVHEQAGLTAGTLAAIMRVRPATMTGLMDRLIKHGLIKRQADATDRRVTRVFLTVEGHSVVKAIETASRAYLETIFDRMGEESVERLIEALRDFARTAESVQDAGEFQP